MDLDTDGIYRLYLTDSSQILLLLLREALRSALLANNGGADLTDSFVEFL